MSEHHSISPQLKTNTETMAAAGVKTVAEAFQKENNFEPFQRIPIQFKLAIGAVDDPLEHEADAMADKVMRMPEQNFLQRKCSQCKDEEQVQRKPLVSFIQRKESSADSVVSDQITSKIESSKGNGNSMDRPTQSFMESRFGVDFSNVKIHTSDYAVQMSQELNAQAFTVGRDIYFNSGKYNPTSDGGKHLLAHELTHTVQQGGVLQEQQVMRRAAHITPPSRPACPSPSPNPNDFIRLIVVNQETPQQVTIFWNYSNTSETARCSSGKGGCCVPDTAGDDVVGCTAAQSLVNGSNCTAIGTFRVNSIDRQSHSGVQFWTQFVGSPRFIALHEYAPVDGTPLSHGCVRMDHDMAVKIYCGSIAGRTMVEVRGFARPRCNNKTLVNEWKSDFEGALNAADGDAHGQETRREMMRHLSLGRGRAGQQALDKELDAMVDATSGNIKSSLVESHIPKCQGRSGLGAETERNQRASPKFVNQSIVNDFRIQLGLARTLADARITVQAAGRGLWTNGHGTWNAKANKVTVDDRNLYWTRILILRELAEWNPVFSLNPTQRQRIMQLMEMSSRGLDTTSFQKFDSDVKRILISGFDPFTDVKSGNPSGAIVLALDGQKVSNGSRTGIVKGVVFPVRYHEFDNGMVENYFSPFLTGSNAADMIMTISLSPGRTFDPTSRAFPAHGNVFLDHWAARQRGGFDDNNEQRSTDATFETNLRKRYRNRRAGREEFINSTLPFPEITNGNAATVDNSFIGNNSTTGAVHNPETNNAGNPAGLTAVEGSGGDFLSNEIFYRVRLLQLNQSPPSQIPMGHVHVPNAAPAQYANLVNRVKQMIINALTFLS